jgi:hypothetical protein
VGVQMVGLKSADQTKNIRCTCMCDTVCMLNSVRFQLHMQLVTH